MGGLGWSPCGVGIHGAFVQNTSLCRAEFRDNHGGLGMQGQVERDSQRRGSFGGHGAVIGEVGTDVQVGSAVHGRGSFTNSRVVQGGRHEPVNLEDYENVEIGLSLNAQSFFQ